MGLESAELVVCGVASLLGRHARAQMQKKASKRSFRVKRPHIFYRNRALAWSAHIFLQIELSSGAVLNFGLEMQLSRGASSHFFFKSSAALVRNVLSSQGIFLLFLAFYLCLFCPLYVGLLAFWLFGFFADLTFCLRFFRLPGFLASLLSVWLCSFFFLFWLFGRLAYLTFCLFTDGCLTLWLLGFLASSVSGSVVFWLFVPSSSSCYPKVMGSSGMLFSTKGT